MAYPLSASGVRGPIDYLSKVQGAPRAYLPGAQNIRGLNGLSIKLMLRYTGPNRLFITCPRT
jgi:hypothetical protein